MISFMSDYAQGAHPRMLQAIAAASYEHNECYLEDVHCVNAAKLIGQRLGKECFVTFMPTGTAANLAVIGHFLKPHQAVISADSGHISTNETGAIEATGHKVIACPSENGKLTVETIKKALADHWHVPYVVQPKMVYISQPTELSTLYSKAELTAISKLCREKSLYLYVDGARLGMALAAMQDELTLADLAELTDGFTIGGTKNGALFGEAVVIANLLLAEDFLFSVRQRGAMFARSSTLGIQFEEFFKDNLYVELGDHANRMAKLLKEGMVRSGFTLYPEPETNQLFVNLDNKLIERLSKDFTILIWQGGEATSLVRLTTSWATTEEDVRLFLAALA